MTFRLASDEIEELRRALFSAYHELILEIEQSRAMRFDAAGIELCRRKWKLETMLRRLDGPEEPPAVLKLVPRRQQPALELVAA